MSTPLHPFTFKILISLKIRSASEVIFLRSHCICHNLMPPFSRHNPEKCQERISKVLEICMAIQVVLKFYVGKNGDPQNRKNVQNKSKEHANVGQFWNSVYESLENLLQPFSFSDNLKHPCNSKRSNNRGQRHKIDVQEEIECDTNKGRQYNKENKYVPTVLEVV